MSYRVIRACRYCKGQRHQVADRHDPVIKAAIWLIAPGCQSLARPFPAAESCDKNDKAGEPIPQPSGWKHWISVKYHHRDMNAYLALRWSCEGAVTPNSVPSIWPEMIPVAANMEGFDIIKVSAKSPYLDG